MGAGVLTPGEGIAPISTKLLYVTKYQNRYMDRESTDRTGRSIDRFIKSEMIISKGFGVSARKMFGDGYNATIRNLSREGKQIIEYLSGDADMANVTDVERLQLLFERGVGADDVKVELADGKLILTTKHCEHHLGKNVREKIGISATRVCPVGILATCLIRNATGRKVRMRWWMLASTRRLENAPHILI